MHNSLLQSVFFTLLTLPSTLILDQAKFLMIPFWTVHCHKGSLEITLAFPLTWRIFYNYVNSQNDFFWYIFILYFKLNVMFRMFNEKCFRKRWNSKMSRLIHLQFEVFGKVGLDFTLKNHAFCGVIFFILIEACWYRY